MTFEPTLLPLLVRVATTALVVIAASLASERAGPFWGAIIVSLPVSAGPAYVLLALAQDPAFISGSALTSLASHGAAGSYLVIYAHLAQRRSTLVCVGASLATWLAAVSVVRIVPWTALSASIVTVIAFAACLYATRRLLRPGAAPATTSVRRWYDLPLRALGVATLVTTVVTLSNYLGPAVTGIAAVFPVAVTSLGLTLQPRLGGPATGAVMAGTIRAMPGMGAGFLVLHLMAVPLGSAVALSLALLTALIWPLMLVVLRARREGRARAVT